MAQEQQSKLDVSSLRIDKSRKFDDAPKTNWTRYAVIVLVIAAALFGYFSLKDRVTPATAVKVARASLLGGSDAAADLVATGYVVAQRKAEVASKGTGRLEYIGFEEGDIVRSGEVIARLDNNDIQASLNVARATLKQREVDTLNAGRDYRRRQALLAAKSITDVELEASELSYFSSLAAVEGAKAGVTMTEVELENTFIRAPFTGTVLTKNADLGEIVAPFASSASSKGSVVTLADMSSLEVEADVSEASIVKVRPNQRCEIVLDAYPAVRYGGFVKKIVPTADRAKATVLTKIAFDTLDARVLPEMSARVNFLRDGSSTSPDEQVLVVPSEAVTTRNERTSVFLISGELARMVEVTTGRQFSGQVEILAGLSVGDRVVLDPPGKMVDGDKVEIAQ